MGRAQVSRCWCRSIRPRPWTRRVPEVTWFWSSRSSAWTSRPADSADWWFSWNMTGTWLSRLIGNVIFPTDELIFFRGVAIPPTRRCPKPLRNSKGVRDRIGSAWALHGRESQISWDLPLNRMVMGNWDAKNRSSVPFYDSFYVGVPEKEAHRKIMFPTVPYHQRIPGFPLPGRPMHQHLLVTNDRIRLWYRTCLGYPTVIEYSHGIAH